MSWRSIVVFDPSRSIHYQLDIKLRHWLDRREAGWAEMVCRQYLSGSDTRQLERRSRVFRRQQAIDGRERCKKTVCKNKNHFWYRSRRRHLPCSFAGEQFSSKEQFTNSKQLEPSVSFFANSSSMAASGTREVRGERVRGERWEGGRRVSLSCSSCDGGGAGAVSVSNPLSTPFMYSCSL